MRCSAYSKDLSSALLAFSASRVYALTSYSSIINHHSSIKSITHLPDLPGRCDFSVDCNVKIRVKNICSFLRDIRVDFGWSGVSRIGSGRPHHSAEFLLLDVFLRNALMWFCNLFGISVIQSVCNNKIRPVCVIRLLNARRLFSGEWKLSFI